MDPVDSLCQEPISRLGDLPLYTVSRTDTVADALRAMKSHKTGCVLVCEDGRPVGVLTERDILRRMVASLPMDAALEDVISGDVWSVLLSDPVGTALRKMNERHCRHLAVVAEDGSAIGILSVRAIVHLLVEQFPSSIYNLPPVANQVQTSREGA